MAMTKGPWELHQAGLAAWWGVDQLHGEMGLAGAVLLGALWGDRGSFRK